MNMYIDSSVLLRVVLGESGRLNLWSRIETAISSELIRLECLRTIDRARIRFALKDKSVARYRAAVMEVLDTFSLISLDSFIVERASDPFPTGLGSLDAIHLATALLAREEFEGLELATHDDELATAARAVGFRVRGAG